MLIPQKTEGYCYRKLNVVCSNGLNSVVRYRLVELFNSSNYIHCNDMNKLYKKQ